MRYLRKYSYHTIQHICELETGCSTERLGWTWSRVWLVVKFNWNFSLLTTIYFHQIKEIWPLNDEEINSSGKLTLQVKEIGIFEIFVVNCSEGSQSASFKTLNHGFLSTDGGCVSKFRFFPEYWKVSSSGR